MPWRPLPQIAFAVAIYPFQPSSPADLPLELGDELYVIEEGGVDKSWYRGYLVAPPSLLAGLTSVKGQTLEARVFSGIFPRTCVEIRELLGETGAAMPTHGQEEGNGETEKMAAKLAATKPTTNGSSENGQSMVDSGYLSSSIPDPTVPQAHTGDSNDASRKGSPKTPISKKALAPVLPLTPISMNSSRPSKAPRPPAPVPMLKIGDETPTSASEPLVDEIASCLREWHSTNLHEMLLSRRYDELDKLSKLVNQVDLSRRQLLHGVLTNQELEALREKTVWDLVRGNKMLANEVIVRDPKQRGRLLTGNDNPFEVSKLQSSMSLLDKPPTATQDNVNLHHLMFELKDVSNYAKEIPTLMVYLCTKRPNEPLQPLTEAYSIVIPARESLAKIGSTLGLKTLFTDLTSMDTGETSGSETQLYLVLKAKINRLTQPASLTPARAGTTRDSASPRKETSNSAAGQTSAKGGRQSLMWAKNKLPGSQRQRTHLTSVTDESKSSVELQEDESSTARTTPEPSSNQQGPQVVKKDVGVAVLQLGNFLNLSRESDHVVNLWTPSESRSEVKEGDEGWEEVIQSLISSTSGQYTRSRLLNRLKFRLHSFLDPDVDDLIRKTPTLLHSIPKTPKIGFSGAPTKPRSDIYITLSQPILPGQPLFAHPDRGAVQLPQHIDMRNLQLTLEVRKSSGERLERCIFPSSNSPGDKAWRTTAIPRGGVWAQTIRLAVPSEDVADSHIIMSMADFPGPPFALCWMPLWRQGAFIQDGTHLPLFHVYDKSTVNAENGRRAYLDLAWDSKAKDAEGRDSWLGHMAHLKLESYLCSTTFSQNEALLGILRWRDQSDNQLLLLLRQVVFVPEIEIVKLVSDVFDALFAILVDRSGNDEYEDLVFSALVTVLGIVHDRRFNLDPLVHEYAEVRFNFPFATPCLIRSYLRLITRPADYQNSRQLRATFKVGRQIMKFIVVARMQQKAKEAGIGITNTGPVFRRDFKKIFEALEAQMRDQSASLIGSKTLLVQHMHTWLPELSPCFSHEEILDIAISFVNSCADVSGRLILHKLILIYSLSKASTVMSAALRERFDQYVEIWLNPHWGSTSDPNEQYREQVRLCCSILTLRNGDYGSQVARYYLKILQSYHCLRHADRPAIDGFSLLFPTSYPFPTRPSSKPRNYDENLIELAALKATISAHQLLASANEFGDLSPLLAMALEVNMSILGGEAFPSTWLTLHVYHHRIIFNMLDGMTRIMARDLLPSPEEAENFNTELWKNLQIALLRLVRSEVLALETLPEQKRRAVWKIAGDIREQGAEALGRVWDAIGWETDAEEKKMFGLNRLGGYQVQYVPSLVGPIVELCLSIHEGLRGVAVEILQSMIISEWTLNEDLAVVQAEMIYSLDNLFKTRNVGENAQQRLFIAQLLEMFEPLSQVSDKRLWEATKSLISTVDELLDLLVATHAPDQNETFRIMNTLHLMDFLKDMQKEDIYVSYVHQLAAVEAQARNFREAGLALKLHADLYSWNSQEYVDELKSPPLPRQTAFERKESLYFEMITHFEEGSAWESALLCYRELAEQYEYQAFDFAKLAKTQRSTARIYDVISRGEGFTSRYFRVIYRGLGFGSNLRNKQFIYEGNGSDRLTTFMDRLQQQHPAAQFVSHGDYVDAEGQFLQVSVVSPHRDLTHPLYQRPKVPLPTKDFLFSKSPDRFAVTTRRHSPKSGVKDQWVEKTVFITEDSFPTILRRSEIIEERTVALSPLQTAVERTVRKSSELLTLEKRVKDGDNSSVFSMIEAIKSSVDPSSTTSVAQYREILPKLEQNPASPPASAGPPSAGPQLQPLELALQTALLDFASAIKHCLALLSKASHQHEQHNLTVFFSSTFAPELAVIAPHNTIATVNPAFETEKELDNTAMAPEYTNKAPNGTTVIGEPSAQPAAIPLLQPLAPSESSRNKVSSMLKRSQSPSKSQQQYKTNGDAKADGPNTSQPARIDDDQSLASSHPSTHGRKNSQVSWVGSHSDSRDRGKQGSPSISDVRPVTANSAVLSVGKKKSSIRKRLSSLGIGKKPSSVRVTNNGVGTLEEE